MKTRLLSLVALLFAGTLLADQIGPYSYTFPTTPVDAPVTAINPRPGSTVIAVDTGTTYRKVGALGTNAASAYAVDAVELVTTSTPLTGATVTASASKSNETVVITPAGTIAELTFVFPSNTNSRIGQEITLQSSQIVTTLTLTKGGQTITDPAGTALAANVPQRWIKTAASTWVRIANVATDAGVVLTGSVVTDGLTASGSASNDFSGSTGTFKTSSGANTISGDATVAADKDLLFAAGDGKADFSLGTGVFKTSSGTNTLGGNTETAFTLIQTSAAAAAFATGLAGNTNPVFRTVNNIASQATGISITGRAATAGADITVLSSGTDENLVINAKGAGTITLNPTATGNTVIGKGQITPAVQTISGDGAITIASGVAVITKGSIAAVTLAAPSSQDGTVIEVTSTTDFAHVITVTGGMWDGTATTNTTVTFPVVAGAAVRLIAFGTDWYVLSNQGTTIAP